MNDPIASYDNIRYRPNNRSFEGKRGTAGKQGTFSTSFGASNSNLVFYSKLPSLPTNNSSIQLANIAHWAPLRVYDGGTPAYATISPSSGTPFNVIARVPGLKGNNYTITLSDPGVLSPLSVSLAPNGRDITVFLANNGTSPISTAYNVVTALNNDPVVGAIIEASLAATSSGSLSPTSQTPLTGGSTVPGLCFVQLNTSSTGSINSIGSDIVSALYGSQIVGAVQATGNNGTGIVTTLAATPLVGSTQTVGEIADTSEWQKDTLIYQTRPGSDSQNRTHTSGNITKLSRTGSPLEMKTITAQDRAQYQTKDASTRLSQEHGPRSPYL